MREKLIAYVDLLFSGVADADDIKQEILQNTLDRYDDLVTQGKSPEAAYTLSIAGIGDISELPDSTSEKHQVDPEPTVPTPIQVKSLVRKKVAIAVAICLYILCPIPVLMVQEEVKKNSPKTLEVLLDNDTAKGNVTRLAYKLGYDVKVEELEDEEYRLTLTK